MNFEYTDHAEENIIERKFNKVLIESVIKNPDTVTNGRYRRKVAQKAINNKLIRVIFEKQNSVYIIITAYYTKTERYR